MKFLVVLAVAVACASADVSHIVKDEFSAPIVKSSYDISPEGTFQFAYETGNGIYAQADGVVKDPNAEYPTLEVKGAFKYISPEGETIEQTYVANENGFQPQGSNLPVAPPVPDYIVRSLEYIAAHPAPESYAKKATASLVG